MTPRQQEDRRLPPGRHPAGPAGRAADRGDVRHRRQRHAARVGQGQGTGKESKIRIESSSGMSKDEVEKMKRDAELHADEDKKRRELIDAKNKADSLVYQVEKMLKDAGDKMSRGRQGADRAAVEKVKKAKEGDDLNALKSAFGELEQAAHAMAAAQASRLSKAAARRPAGRRPGPADRQEGRRRRGRRRVRGEVRCGDSQWTHGGDAAWPRPYLVCGGGVISPRLSSHQDRQFLGVSRSSCDTRSGLRLFKTPGRGRHAGVRAGRQPILHFARLPHILSAGRVGF